MLRNAHNTPSNGRPLKADLELALKRELRLANDADCFALSEASDGAAKDATLVFGVILGTGCGGGIVSNGRLLTGVNGLCGEWGHNPLPWMLPDEYPGPRCYCGRDGCIEQFIAGPGLARDHLNATGNGLTVLAIADGAAAGEASCCATVDRHVHRVARALASVVNVLDPEVIVLGGGVSSLDYLYERVPQLWGDYVFGGRVKTRLVKNLHGAASGVRGAAWLWSADAA
jgi:fructokinase